MSRPAISSDGSTRSFVKILVIRSEIAVMPAAHPAATAVARIWIPNW